MVSQLPISFHLPSSQSEPLGNSGKGLCRRNVPPVIKPTVSKDRSKHKALTRPRDLTSSFLHPQPLHQIDSWWKRLSIKIKLIIVCCKVIQYKQCIETKVSHDVAQRSHWQVLLPFHTKLNMRISCSVWSTSYVKILNINSRCVISYGLTFSNVSILENLSDKWV